MRQNKRKLLSVLLTLAMLLGMLPALGVPALATSTTVTTKAELMNAVKNSGEIILGADIVLTDEGFDYYPVEIKSGIAITLDLNGHVLDRSRIELGQNESRGGVIENNGTLVIKDSSPSTPHTLYKKSEAWRPNVYTVEDKSGTDGYTVAATITGGAIIGGYNNYGGGINNSGTLTLEGGTICGNEAGTKGGGVWNQSTGTFTMTGGKICNNKTTGGYKWGGGGVQNDGTFLMTGGTITGNSVQYPKGGGVYNAGTFQISGSPVISGNGNGNVYLMSFSEYGGTPIEVVGTLTEDANVGVYPEDTPPITVTTGFKTYMDGQDQTKYFSSDRSGWYALLDANGEVMLSKPDPVPYVYYTASGTTATKHTDGSCEGYTAVKSDTTNWTAGWYVASGEVTIADRITVTGEVNLILTDGAKLTANSSVYLPEGSTLNIFGQTEGTGALYANPENDYSAGIGGINTDEWDYDNWQLIPGDTKYNCGQLVVHGGVIEAIGGSYAAGIGGGDSGNGGVITIYGGTVTGKGRIAAGIGGGYEASGGEITIYGGKVTGESSGNGAGIGGGYAGTGGKITINGGEVIGIGGNASAGIGTGYYEIEEMENAEENPNIVIDEDNKTITFTNVIDLTVNGGTVTATGGKWAAGIGTGEIDMFINGYDFKLSGSVTVNDGTVTATGSTGAAGIGGGFNTSGIDITANGGITKTAAGTLVITDNNLQNWSPVPFGGIHDDEASVMVWRMKTTTLAAPSRLAKIC